MIKITSQQGAAKSQLKCIYVPDLSDWKGYDYLFLAELIVFRQQDYRGRDHKRRENYYKISDSQPEDLHSLSHLLTFGLNSRSL